MRAVLRGFCAIFLGLAIVSACVVIVLDSFRYFDGPPGLWRLKSAFPLIFIGLSYGCLQFSLPRMRRELVLGLSVSTAFILWGAEQFVPDPAIALLMDNAVMFLFVLDLGIVICGQLKQRRI